jgi:hypothetical protein
MIFCPRCGSVRYLETGRKYLAFECTGCRKLFTAIEGEMALPAGKTCAECVHLGRCVKLGCTTPDRRVCDFHPSRFKELEVIAS